MARILICTAVLVGFIAAMKFGLYQALDSWGFGPFAMLCLTIIGCTIAAAFAYDHLSARSPRSTPRELNDRPPSMQ
jgi:hypothetical protein